MRLEHDEPQGRLIITDAEPDELGALREVFRTLAEETGRRVSIHGLPFITSVNDCRLQAVSRDRDDGVTARDKPGSFKWTLTSESWSAVEQAMTPLCADEANADVELHAGPGPAVIIACRG
jgi:hypothetical protein